MKFIATVPERSNITLADLTPGEQDLLYDAITSYTARSSSSIRATALSRLQTLLESVVPAGTARDYNAAANTAFRG